MSREQFSEKIKIVRQFHYSLIGSYVDTLREIENQPFFVKPFGDSFLLIDIILTPFRLFTWKSLINLFAESHIKSRIKLLKKYYIFLLQKAPSTAKSTDINWLKEIISKLENFDQSLDSWLKTKSIMILFGSIIIGFLLTIYQASNIYSLLLGLNIGQTFLSFTDITQFGLVTMVISMYSPFLGTFSYFYKDSLFYKYKIKNNEKKVFSLFSKNIPKEISYNVMIFSVFLTINFLIILRTYIRYREIFFAPEYLYIVSWLLSHFVIFIFVDLKKEKTPEIKSIPFDVLEKGLDLADFYYEIGITKSLFDGYDEKIHEKITINGKVVLRFFKTKVTLEDLMQGQIKVQYNDQSIIVVPDIG